MNEDNIAECLCPLALQLLEETYEAALSSEAIFTILGGAPPLSRFSVRLAQDHPLLESVRSSEAHAALRDKTADLHDLGALLESTLARLLSAFPLFPVSPSYAMYRSLWDRSPYAGTCTAACCPFLASFEDPLAWFDHTGRGIPIELMLDPHYSEPRRPIFIMGRSTVPVAITLHVNVFNWRTLEAQGINRDAFFPVSLPFMQQELRSSLKRSSASLLFSWWGQEQPYSFGRPHVVSGEELAQEHIAPFSGLLDCLTNAQHHLNEGTGSGALPFAFVSRATTPTLEPDGCWVAVPRAASMRAMFLVQHSSRGPIIVCPTLSGLSKLGWIHDPAVAPRLYEREIQTLQDRFAMLEACRGLSRQAKVGAREVISLLCLSADSLDPRVAIDRCRALCGEGNIPSGGEIQRWWEVSMRSTSSVMGPLPSASVFPYAEELVRAIDTYIAIGVVWPPVLTDWEELVRSFAEIEQVALPTPTIDSPVRFDFGVHRAGLLRRATQSIPCNRVRAVLPHRDEFRGLRNIRYPFVELGPMFESQLLQVCSSIVDLPGKIRDPFVAMQVNSSWKQLEQVAERALASVQDLDLNLEMVRYLADRWVQTLAIHNATWDRVCNEMMHRQFSYVLEQILQRAAQTTATTTTTTTTSCVSTS